MRLFAAALIAFMGVGLISPAAHAESTAKRLDDVNVRLEKLERVLANQSLLDLAQHIDELQNDVRQLRGRVEELENTTQQLKKKEAQLEKERAAAAAAAAVAPPPPPAAVAPAAGAAPAAVAAAPAKGGEPSGAEEAAGTVEQTVYQQAFDALSAHSYSIAAIGFKDFVQNYPASPLVANATYWLGWSYFSAGDFEPAIAAFRQLYQHYPEDKNVPNAMMRIGLAQLELKRAAEGRATLLQVARKFPGTDAAKKAAERLQRMGVAVPQ